MTKFSRLFSFILLSAILLSAASIALTVPAYAGFEWKPAAAAPVAQPLTDLPPVPAIPQAGVDMMALNTGMSSTMTMDEPTPPNPPMQQIRRTRPSADMLGGNMVSSPPVMPPDMRPAPTPPEAPLVRAEPDMKMSAAVAPAMMATSGAYADAVGFGSDIPLALAMRQIIPAQYAYAFDSDVDQSTRITWNGGKPWDVVLSDAIVPLGLGVSVEGQVVRITPVSKLSAPSPLPPAAPVAMTMTTAMAAMADPVPYAEPAMQPPVQEVYVRRESESDGFWSRLGLKSDAAPAKKDYVTRTAGGVIMTPATPAVPAHDIPVDRSIAITGAAPGVPVSLTATPDTVVPVEERGAVTPATGMDMHSFWQAEKGDSLKNVLQTWSDDSGVKLYWVSVEDYRLPAAIRVEGSYTEAVSKVLTSYGETGVRPVGRLHPNQPAGPAVLIIEPAGANS